jgi:hypothetical protein
VAAPRIQVILRRNPRFFIPCRRLSTEDEAQGTRKGQHVYNAAFEQARLDECCGLLPDCRSWYPNVERRTVVLLKPFWGLQYYAPGQNGSASMKAVLPALTGRSYADLEIQEGNTASLEYLRVTFGDVHEDERRHVRRLLEEYCCQDTERMVWIFDAFRRLVG